MITCAKEANGKFNKDKIQYKVGSVKYMGHPITPDGVKVVDAKVQDVVDMPFPKDRPTLQRMLGIVEFLSQYIPCEA